MNSLDSWAIDCVRDAAVADPQRRPVLMNARSGPALRNLLLFQVSRVHTLQRLGAMPEPNSGQAMFNLQLPFSFGCGLKP